jgi:hypothetical protein
MSELNRWGMKVEKIDGTCVRLEPLTAIGSESRGGAGAGTGINAVIVETSESTPASAFGGSAATCIFFDVIIRRRS